MMSVIFTRLNNGDCFCMLCFLHFQLSTRPIYQPFFLKLLRRSLGRGRLSSCYVSSILFIISYSEIRHLPSWFTKNWVHYLTFVILVVQFAFCRKKGSGAPWYCSHGLALFLLYRVRQSTALAKGFSPCFSAGIPLQEIGVFDMAAKKIAP